MSNARIYFTLELVSTRCRFAWKLVLRPSLFLGPPIDPDPGGPSFLFVDGRVLIVPVVPVSASHACVHVPAAPVSPAIRSACCSDGGDGRTKKQLRGRFVDTVVARVPGSHVAAAVGVGGAKVLLEVVHGFVGVCDFGEPHITRCVKEAVGFDDVVPHADDG